MGEEMDNDAVRYFKSLFALVRTKHINQKTITYRGLYDVGKTSMTTEIEQVILEPSIGKASSKHNI